MPALLDSPPGGAHDNTFALLIPPCAFCAGRSCDVCAGQDKFIEKAKVDRIKRREGRFRPRVVRVYKCAPDGCEKCGRVPNDRGQPRCVYCPPDVEGPRRCVRNCGRPARTCFGLCRKCYDGLSLDEREALPRRPYRPTPKWLNTDAPAERPEEATRFAPGTQAKLRVIAGRVDLRKTVDHPDDMASRPVDLLVAFVQMCVSKEARGIHKDGPHWRARPWWGYSRYHLGYFRELEKAVSAVKRWKELADEDGPRKAMIAVRKELRARRLA